MPRILRAALMLAALTAGTLLPACTKDDHPAAVPASEPTDLNPKGSTARPPTNDAATTTTPARNVQQEVEAAYQRILDEFLQQLTKPNPDAVDLRDYIHPYREFVLETHLAFQTAGQVSAKGPSGSWPRHQFISTEVDGDRAIVTACTLDDSRVIEAETGKILDDDITTKLTVARLVRIDDHWRMANNTLKEQWQDDQGCRQ